MITTETYRLPDCVEYADPEHGGGSYLYRAGHLVVAKKDQARCTAMLARLNQSWRILDCTDDVAADSRYARIEVGLEPHSVPELVTAIRACVFEGGETIDCSPQHVLVPFGHPIPISGCSCPGDEADSLGEGPAYGSTGEMPGDGVRVAVLDSGFVDDHPFLAGRVHGDLADIETATQDQMGRLRWYAGHGTFVAGVVLQQAPGATVEARNILTIDGGVLDLDGLVLDEALARHLHAVPEDVCILNLSLGATTHGNTGLPLTREALDWLSERNPELVVVAAAGNDGDPTPVFPAAYKSVIGVAALDDEGHGACFTNHGHWVDVCAPGVNVCSAFFDYDGDVEPIPPRHTCPEYVVPTEGLDFDWSANWSGTSFATPYVVGAIASTMTTEHVGAQEAAFMLCGPGHRRLVDGGRDLGVVVGAIV